VAAINWAIANKDAYKICSINLSLGDSNRNKQHCGSSLYEGAFAAARAAGIVPVVASGNEYYSDGISGPACAPSALSVGAVHDSDHGAFDSCDTATAADKVACFSNVAPFLDILAPGSSITAGGWSMSGTSMAAPHVAAAAAVLRAAKPSATADQVAAVMKLTGTKVADAAVGLTFPRLNLDAAFSALTGLTSLPPPSASVSINGGAAMTPSPRVTLAITVSGSADGLTMCVSNTAACDKMVPFAATIKWTLAEPTANGRKTVNVWLADAMGNKMAAPAAASIDFALGADSAPPANAPQLTAVPDASGTSVTLTWDPSSVADDVTGLSHFVVVYKAGSSPPIKCSQKRGVAAASVALGDATGTAVVNGLKANRKYRFRLCSVDYAGNTSDGVLASASTRKRRSSSRRLLA
jgi:subtilisin family serine protease